MAFIAIQLNLLESRRLGLRVTCDDVTELDITGRCGASSTARHNRVDVVTPRIVSLQSTRVMSTITM